MVATVAASHPFEEGHLSAIVRFPASEILPERLALLALKFLLERLVLLASGFPPERLVPSVLLAQEVY